MKNYISRIVGVAAVTLSVLVAVSAQNQTIASAAGDKYVISAKAGGVNFVEGAVGVVRKEGRSGLLLKGDKLQIGDRVSSGADGKAEILLNPGSYLRLGGNSSFEFKTTSLDDLQIRLDSGSAIFEVFATEDFKVSVNSPKTNFTLIESGVYRIDVDKDGTGKVAVWKGKALIGDDETAVVKKGHEASLVGEQAAIAKFDRDDQDPLDTWSKSRAKSLAKISDSLSRNDVRTSLMRSFLGRRWNVYDSFGLWVFDPFSGSQCFLPFGYGWYSPYGYGFGHSLWYYNLPGVVYQPPSVVFQPASGGIRVPGTGTPSSIKPHGIPAFVQAQGSNGPTGRDVSSVKGGGGRGSSDIGGDPIRSSGGSGSSGSSGSTYSPPPAPPAPVRSVSNTKGNN